MKSLYKVLIIALVCLLSNKISAQFEENPKEFTETENPMFGFGFSCFCLNAADFGNYAAARQAQLEANLWLAGQQVLLKEAIEDKLQTGKFNTFEEAQVQFFRSYQANGVAKDYYKNIEQSINESVPNHYDAELYQSSKEKAVVLEGRLFNLIDPQNVHPDLILGDLTYKGVKINEISDVEYLKNEINLNNAIYYSQFASLTNINSVKQKFKEAKESDFIELYLANQFIDHYNNLEVDGAVALMTQYVINYNTLSTPYTGINYNFNPAAINLNNVNYFNPLSQAITAYPAEVTPPTAYDPDFENARFDHAIRSTNTNMHAFLSLPQNKELRNRVMDFLTHQKYNQRSIHAASQLFSFFRPGSQVNIDNLLRDAVVKETGFIIPGSECCPDDPLVMSDPFYGGEVGVFMVRNFLDGFGSLAQALIELLSSHERQGAFIRVLMEEKMGVGVVDDIDNETLSRIYRVRTRGRALVVEYQTGIVGNLIDLGLSTVDVLALFSPSKGGTAFLAIRGGGRITLATFRNFIRLAGINGQKIDALIDFYKNGAKFDLDGTGLFNAVRGHHPLSKIAFKGDKFYDLNKAFSVSIAKLNRIKPQIHAKITGQQNKLYSKFKRENPGKLLTIEKMAEIELNAMKNAGVPEDIAKGWIIKALENLKEQGVKFIINVPWNGLNN